MSPFAKKIWGKLKHFFNYYLIHRADPVAYLRDQGAQIGENCSLLGGIVVFNSAEPYLIRIGDNVTITQGVLFVTHDGGTRVFRNSNPAWTDRTVMMGTIEIGNNVFIGVGSIILPNVKIGSNVVIGAGSIVSKSIPSDVVAFGSPAHVVSTIAEYETRCLEKSITIPVEFTKTRKEYLKQYYWSDKFEK